MAIDTDTPVVLEPASQAIAEATAQPPFLYELTPDEARKVLDDLQAAPIAKPHVDAHWTTVPTPAGDVRVRIVRPPGAVHQLPVVLYMHGGGWVLGNARTHDRLVRDSVERHGGHIVKSQGDGFMIVFRDPADAVRAGIDVQDSIASGSHRKLRKTPIRVRVGIHSGTVVEKDGDYFGTNVAMAARVAAMAGGGEILVSDRVRQALRDAEDADDVVLVDARETELKGLPGTHRLWQVALI